MIRRGIHPSAIVECLGDAVIPDSTIVEPLAVIYIGTGGRLSLGDKNTLYPGMSIRIDQGWMVTGSEVSFGSGCHIYEPRAGLTIGHQCMIGGGVLICGVNHGHGDRLTPMRHQPHEAAPIALADNVWVGMGAILLPGVTIGEGAIIAAGAVVTRNVPAGAVVAGIPARLVRHRP